jgi:hypothetical protein
MAEQLDLADGTLSILSDGNEGRLAETRPHES